MGFWFFSSDPTLGTAVFRVMYEDNFMITVITDVADSKLYAHCFIGLELYDILGKTDTAANLLALVAGTNESSTINFKKSATSINEKKWKYIRCGYSYSRMKLYLDTNGEGFPGSSLTETTLKMPPYFATDTITLPPRKFYSSNPNLVISSMTGLPTTTQYIFVRNIALFSDYIHPNIYFHYQ